MPHSLSSALSLTTHLRESARQAQPCTVQAKSARDRLGSNQQAHDCSSQSSIVPFARRPSMSQRDGVGQNSPYCLACIMLGSSSQ